MCACDGWVGDGPVSGQDMPRSDIRLEFRCGRKRSTVLLVREEGQNCDLVRYLSDPAADIARRREYLEAESAIRSHEA